MPKKIEIITSSAYANENAPWAVDEPWSTTDEEGFACYDRITVQEKLNMLREKVNEIINYLNE